MYSSNNCGLNTMALKEVICLQSFLYYYNEVHCTCIFVLMASLSYIDIHIRLSFFCNLLLLLEELVSKQPREHVINSFVCEENIIRGQELSLCFKRLVVGL